VSTAPPQEPGPRPTTTKAPAAAVRVVPVRHWGRWVAAVIVIAAVVAIVVGLAGANIAYSTIPDYLHSHVILVGLRNTIIISVLAQAIGIALGVIFAIMRLSKNPVVSTVSWVYIWFFRGTPVLVQLVIWFNLSLAFATISIPIPFTDHFLLHESMNTFMTPFVAALLGLGLNEGAYMAEIVRAGIISVDEGQTEAAAALGMTRGLTMRRVVLPQAMRVIIPPTGNEFINMLKTSSLAQVITYGELFHQAQIVYSAKLNNIELLFVISIWYLVLTSIASLAQYYIERRYARGSARALPDTPLQRLRRNLRPPRMGVAR
jgi:polar amino acid transport system permease protein